MSLNHLNLTVADVDANRRFFETYFGFRTLLDRGESLVVMADESGFVLSLNNFQKSEEVAYPGAFHIGFAQQSRDQVNAIHSRLTADGFTPQAPHEFHGAWTFYFKAPGGFLVEVLHQEH
jgi:catechol 2,3-dioxygenase-like lactoylglutathione lyase family enzyme